MDYDLIVIGGGPGGYEAAIRAAQLNMKTALIERNHLGGTCLNRGCIPAKAFLHDAHLGLPLQEIIAHKNEVVQALRNGIEQLVSKNKVTLIRGEGVLAAPHRVAVGEQELTAKHILMATGSVPQRPPIPGMDLAGVITSDELLDLDTRPQTLCIIGGGVIGMEFAQAFCALGTKVVVIEARERVLPQMDREISQNISMIMGKRGVELHTAARVKGIERAANERAAGLVVFYEEKGAEASLECDCVLVATGRVAAGLGGSVKPETHKGFACVDGSFATNIEGLYAIGDAVGGMMLAHQASAQGIACVEMLAGLDVQADVNVIPACVYTSPEIACVGITEAEAKEKALDVLSGKFVMSGNGRSLIEGAARGFIKVIVRKEDGVVVGAQLMCERATDMIGELTTAIVNSLTYHQLARSVRAHPTFNEGLQEALHAIDNRAIHIMPGRR